MTRTSCSLIVLVTTSVALGAHPVFAAERVRVATPARVIFVIPYWIAERKVFQGRGNRAAARDRPGHDTPDAAASFRHVAYHAWRPRRRSHRRHQRWIASHPGGHRATAAAVADHQTIDQKLHGPSRRQHRGALPYGRQ